MLPKISVIVPIYKVEPYLKRCIDSILSQTFTDFELILVDDGSPDNCGKICDEYEEKDNRVIVIHKENGGPSSARNAGLDIAKGEWIYFCDSDDYIKSNLFEECLKATHNSDADVIRFGHTYIENGKPYTKFIFQKEYNLCEPNDKLDFILNTLLNWKIGWELWDGLFKADIIFENNIRFAEEINNGEDLCFFLIYTIFCNKIKSIPKSLYNYETNSISITRGNTEHKITALNRFNKLSKTVFNSLKSGCIKDEFYIINNKIISFGLNEFFTVKYAKEIDNWDSAIRNISDKKYFMQQNNAYYNNVLKYSKSDNFYDTIRIRCIYQYLCNLNKNSLKMKLRFINSVFFWKNDRIIDFLLHLPNRILLHILGKNRYNSLKEKFKG